MIKQKKHNDVKATLEENWRNIPLGHLFPLFLGSDSEKTLEEINVTKIATKKQETVA